MTELNRLHGYPQVYTPVEGVPERMGLPDMSSGKRWLELNEAADGRQVQAVLTEDRYDYGQTYDKSVSMKAAQPSSSSGINLGRYTT